MTQDKVRFSTTTCDGKPALAAEGSIRLDESGEFIVRVRKLNENPEPEIVVDLTSVDFLDSAALGVICAVHMERVRNNTKLEIYIDGSESSFVQRLFGDVGLDQLLNIVAK